MTIGDCVEFITWTYYFRRLVKNPSYYQLEDSSPLGVEKHITGKHTFSHTIPGLYHTKMLRFPVHVTSFVPFICPRQYIPPPPLSCAFYYLLSSPYHIYPHTIELVETTLHALESEGCVEINPHDSYHLSTTVLGQVASKYYLCYKTVGVFRKGMEEWRRERSLQQQQQQSHNKGHDTVTTKHPQKQGPTSGPSPSPGSLPQGEISSLWDVPGTLDVERLTRLVCQALEFSELPVRHNEELLNAELADILTWDVSDLPMDNAHTKALLLLQAHFERARLPISGN